MNQLLNNTQHPGCVYWWSYSDQEYEEIFLFCQKDDPYKHSLQRIFMSIFSFEPPNNSIIIYMRIINSYLKAEIKIQRG